MAASASLGTDGIGRFCPTQAGLDTARSLIKNSVQKGDRCTKQSPSGVDREDFVLQLSGLCNGASRGKGSGTITMGKTGSAEDEVIVEEKVG